MTAFFWSVGLFAAGSAAIEYELEIARGPHGQTVGIAGVLACVLAAVSAPFTLTAGILNLLAA